MSVALTQSWNAYQDEARAYRIKEYGYDILSNSTDYLLNEAMLLLADAPGSLFLGQGVAFEGHAMFKDLNGVPMEQRIELPVVEELQLGMSIGLSLQGYLPVSIYPRMDFMLRAMDQLVLHLDKLESMSCGQFCPKVIIRTRVGSKKPLDAGPQHTNDFTEAFRLMLTNVEVAKIVSSDQIMPAYRGALARSKSTLIVEAF